MLKEWNVKLTLVGAPNETFFNNFSTRYSINLKFCDFSYNLSVKILKNKNFEKKVTWFYRYPLQICGRKSWNHTVAYVYQFKATRAIRALCI